MTYTYSTTIEEERKKGQHLDAEARGAIQQLKKLGYSNRAIAREVNCSPSTVGYELIRGTPAYSGRGRKPEYSAKRGAVAYKKIAVAVIATKRFYAVVNSVIGLFRR